MGYLVELNLGPLIETRADWVLTRYKLNQVALRFLLDLESALVLGLGVLDEGCLLIVDSCSGHVEEACVGGGASIALFVSVDCFSISLPSNSN